jgi:LPXTG-motif cell wall-anchored protein
VLTTTTGPVATPAEIADNPGPHLILLAVLVLAAAGFFLYRRRRNRDRR